MDAGANQHQGISMQAMARSFGVLLVLAGALLGAAPAEAKKPPAIRIGANSCFVGTQVCVGNAGIVPVSIACATRGRRPLDGTLMAPWLQQTTKINDTVR
jgi:hypothetical protein